jgi:aminoglycoside 6'-N-acetyltransferase
LTLAREGLIAHAGAGALQISLRPLTPEDWPRLRKWLRDPAVTRWWGSPASSEAGIRLVIETNSALSRVIEVSGTPVGYAHAIDATCWGEALPDALPPWTWDVDLFIGEAPFRGREVGCQALDILAREVFGTTLAMALSVFVSVRNEAAVRAYERAGFKWVTVWEDPVAGPVWLMLRQRPSKG